MSSGYLTIHLVLALIYCVTMHTLSCFPLRHDDALVRSSVARPQRHSYAADTQTLARDFAKIEDSLPKSLIAFGFS